MHSTEYGVQYLECEVTSVRNDAVKFFYACSYGT